MFTFYKKISHVHKKGRSACSAVPPAFPSYDGHFMPYNGGNPSSATFVFTEKAPKRKAICAAVRRFQPRRTLSVNRFARKKPLFHSLSVFYSISIPQKHHKSSVYLKFPVLFFEKKSRHRSFLREEKKAKEALIIGLRKFCKQQTEMVFSSLFLFRPDFFENKSCQKKLWQSGKEDICSKK